MVLFAVQHFTLVPLIEAAEHYEEADHHGTDWKPADGWERTAWTVVTTVVTRIGFAAVLFGFLSLTRRNITMRTACCGNSRAFVCFHLAPSLGLPPLPPGVPVSDVQPRQLWWLWAVLSTAAGLWLFTGSNPDAQNRWRACRCHATFHRCAGWRGRQRRARRVDAELHYRVTRRCRDLWTVLGGIGGFLAARSEH